MAWAAFSGDFDWTPPNVPLLTIGYLAGMRCSVTEDCLAAAQAAGRAEKIRTPRREVADLLKADPFWRGDNGDPGTDGA